jgi:hypothetical protein
MITFAAFNNLTLKQQLDLLCYEGIYLCSRQEPEFMIDLYQVDAYYIEAFYHRKTKKMISIRSFTSTDLLHPYFVNSSLPFFEPVITEIDTD